MDTEERKRIAQEATKVMKCKERICANCGSEFNVQIHHIVPVSQGGGNKESNLVFLCAECHKKAHAYVNNRVKESGDYPSVKGHKTCEISVLERVKKIKRMAKDLKICRPFLFEGFKEYVELLSANDPSVLSKEDIATMELLMYYRELGMSKEEFEKFISGVSNAPMVQEG